MMMSRQDTGLCRCVGGVLLFLASFGAVACPLCLAFALNATGEDLVRAERSVLVVPEKDGKRFRVVEVIRGEPPADRTIPLEAIIKLDGSDSIGGKPLLLLRENRWAAWVNFGAIDAKRADWLRELAAGKHAADMSESDWREHLVAMLPSLESSDPLVAEIAYGEFANAPYAALRSVKAQLDLPTLRRWTADLLLAKRHPVYTLLTGVAGDATDAARYRQRLELAWKSNDATNVGPMLAAVLELEGVRRMNWLEQRYIRNRNRTAPELEAVVLALSVHGDADATIPRERVISSFRLFMREHKAIAGYVARELAEWNYWNAAAEYRLLLRSGTEQDPASKIAIMMYLQHSPDGVRQ